MDTPEEYRAELSQLADEWKLGKDTIKEITARESVIRKRVFAIADKIKAASRVVFRLPELDLQWDRQVAKKAGTGDVSLDQLETVLGAKKFKALCTTRTVTYTFDLEKFFAARESGEITDAMILTCTVPQEYTPRLSLTKMARVVEDQDIDESEYN